MAKKIDGRRLSAWVVAGLVAVAGMVMTNMIPHPVWMQIGAVIAPLAGGLVASHLVTGERRP